MIDYKQLETDLLKFYGRATAAAEMCDKKADRLFEESPQDSENMSAEGKAGIKFIAGAAVGLVGAAAFPPLAVVGACIAGKGGYDGLKLFIKGRTSDKELEKAGYLRDQAGYAEAAYYAIKNGEKYPDLGATSEGIFEHALMHARGEEVKMYIDGGSDPDFAEDIHPEVDLEAIGELINKEAAKDSEKFEEAAEAQVADLLDREAKYNALREAKAETEVMQEA